MRTYVKDSWKKKIDPFFDRPVKSYVVSLNEFERSGNEGRLNFPDDFVDTLIDNPDWQSLTDSSFNMDMLHFVKKAGLINGQVLRNVLEAFSFLKNDNIDSLRKVYPKMVRSLPEEESRRFYLDELKRISSNPASRLEDYCPAFYSLFIRYIYVMFDNAPKEAGKNADMESFRKSNSASTLINSVNLIYTQLAFQSFLPLLVMNAGKGDDESIFRAVTINKSLLFSEDVKNRFLKAQLQGDTKFFKKLANAIANNPLKRIGQHGKTYSVLSIFWYLGLYKLTNEELYYFLVYCGITPPEYPDSFKKFLQRHILPIFNRQFP